MIICEILTQNDLIQTIQLSGHAEFDQFGKDIVCAAVSAQVSFVEIAVISHQYLNMVSIQKKNGLVVIDYKLEQDKKELQFLLRTLVLSLLAIEEQYPQNIKVKYKE